MSGEYSAPLYEIRTPKMTHQRDDHSDMENNQEIGIGKNADL